MRAGSPASTLRSRAPSASNRTLSESNLRLTAGSSANTPPLPSAISPKATSNSPSSSPIVAVTMTLGHCAAGPCRSIGTRACRAEAASVFREGCFTRVHSRAFTGTIHDWGFPPVAPRPWRAGRSVRKGPRIHQVTGTARALALDSLSSTRPEHARCIHRY